MSPRGNRVGCVLRFAVDCLRIGCDAVNREREGNARDAGSLRDRDSFAVSQGSLSDRNCEFGVIGVRGDGDACQGLDAADREELINFSFLCLIGEGIFALSVVVAGFPVRTLRRLFVVGNGICTVSERAKFVFGCSFCGSNGDITHAEDVVFERGLFVIRQLNRGRSALEIRRQFVGRERDGVARGTTGSVVVGD